MVTDAVMAPTAEPFVLLVRLVVTVFDNVSVITAVTVVLLLVVDAVTGPAEEELTGETTTTVELAEGDALLDAETGETTTGPTVEVLNIGVKVE